MIPAQNKSSIVVQPTEQAFELSSSLISAQRATILCRRFDPSGAMRRQSARYPSRPAARRPTISLSGDADNLRYWCIPWAMQRPWAPVHKIHKTPSKPRRFGMKLGPPCGERYSPTSSHTFGLAMIILSGTRLCFSGTAGRFLRLCRKHIFRLFFHPTRK